MSSDTFMSPYHKQFSGMPTFSSVAAIRQKSACLHIIWSSIVFACTSFFQV